MTSKGRMMDRGARERTRESWTWADTAGAVPVRGVLRLHTRESYVCALVIHDRERERDGELAQLDLLAGMFHGVGAIHRLYQNDARRQTRNQRRWHSQTQDAIGNASNADLTNLQIISTGDQG